ncbi:membrane trafficking protein, ER to Golgi Psg2 [Schizosaccharomyces osmophilus]|uniref:Membrane trafficking protein, ER to Golgi Psg2 n=1 Tax=Schizosaccharomyces osmophilus TaxID=2545709 RepID=A0AAF0AX32_9SCHI|nr:membrane trafficking protein, ER to Golgi Psg2 [Schizosaccharomyces osmophilus]WBW75421.1 membrane trafficking protein, ER to Golgi Psg2 [Schizosaccharomyces osmophilus]
MFLMKNIVFVYSVLAYFAHFCYAVSSKSGAVPPGATATKVYRIASGTHVTGVETTIFRPHKTYKGLPTDAYYNCHPQKYYQSDMPICLPTPGSRWIKGKPQRVTWDPLYFKADELRLVLSYQNKSGLIAMEKKIKNKDGELNLKPNDKWLHGDFLQNLTVNIISVGEGNPTFISGPNITLQKSLDPQEQYAEEQEIYAPKRNLKAAIAVPSIFLGIILMIVLYHTYRKDTWKIFIAKMRLRKSNAGYGVRKSRRQRTRGRPTVSLASRSELVYDDSEDEEYFNSQLKKMY